jgi:hypothetical protein
MSPRFQRRLDADLGYADGHIFVPAPAATVTNGATGATNVATYNGITSAGVTSLGTAATAYILTIPLAELVFRYGVRDDLQERFGAGGLGGSPFGAGGTNVNQASTLVTANAGPSTAAVNLTVVSSVNFTVGFVVQVDTGASAEFQTVTAVPDATHVTVGALTQAHTANFPLLQEPFTTPAGVSGSPPFTGFSQLTPVTAPRPKGILLKTLYPVYSVANGVAAPTVNTIGIVGTKFANAVALTTDTILAAAANGLQTAANAANQLYVTPIAIPSAKQVYQTTKFEEFAITWAVTTGAATGTFGIWGIFFDVTYNFN